MRICLVAAALLALPVLSACGSDEPAEPAVTQAQLSKALQDKGLGNPKLADCAAKVFIDSGMSQSGLKVMVASSKPGDPAQQLDKEDAAKATASQSKIATQCVDLAK
ncbi:hypothetical protein ACWEVD_22325 [Nocardia thailandica]|uniref:DUF732 domain-containing protein n=1 Tax=Nocardia thailandica TaxID=257275 RepID=A0ABW6PWI6_9NOCA|nr:hypothetical protein [Nocardia thailandica]